MPPPFRTDRERRLWLLAAAWLLAIYASLYYARIVTEALRERNLLRATVLAVFLLAGGVILSAVLRRRPGWRELAVLALFAAAYAAVLPRLRVIEERVHFLEYGLLAGLIHGALRERLRAGGAEAVGSPGMRPTASVWAAAGAVLLTSLSGWGDEGIQALLPNRVYDLRDVAFNAAAALLAVAALVGLEVARPRDLAARSEPPSGGRGAGPPVVPTGTHFL